MFDVNVKDNNGVTPLHDAARSNNPGIAKMLIKWGADVTAKAYFPSHEDSHRKRRAAQHWNPNVSLLYLQRLVGQMRCNGKVYYSADGHCMTPREVCDANAYGWCNLLGRDGLEEHYQESDPQNDDQLSRGHCSTASQCPLFSQPQLQYLMNVSQQLDPIRQRTECQFYNMTCHKGDCTLGRTWNTYKCIDCNAEGI